MGELTRDAPDSILSSIGINPSDRYNKTVEYFNKGNQIATETGSLIWQRYAWEDLSIRYKKEKEKQLTIAEKEKKLQEAYSAKQQSNSRVRIYTLFAALLAFLLIAIILWRNNQNKQRANTLLSHQKKEIDEQKTKIEQTLV